MRAIAWIGVLLIVLGIAGLAVRSFSYTTKKDVMDIGPIHATADEEKVVDIPPAASIAGIVIGGALLVLGRKKT